MEGAPPLPATRSGPRRQCACDRAPFDEREDDEGEHDTAALKAKRQQEAEPEDDDGIEGRELAGRLADGVYVERSDGRREEQSLWHEPGGRFAYGIPGQLRSERSW